MRTLILLIASIFLILFCGTASAQIETPLTVRVLAKDAKWIGTSMGGVEISIRDQSNGELLAEGLTEGGTGNTDILVHNDKSRYGKLSTPGSAAFQTTLMLDHPVFAEIRATFRTAYGGRPIVKSQTQWLIPGKDMSGDGIVMEMPGFAMRIEHPLPHQTVSLSGDGEARLDLFMIMLCGCPIEPSGTWDSEPMEIEALVYQGDVLIRTIPLTNVETNRFTASLKDLEEGSYQVFVSAFDPRSLNTGVEKIQVTVEK